MKLEPMAPRERPRLTPQQADDVLAVYGWTGSDLYELVHAFARKFEPREVLKLQGGRVVLWIKKGKSS
jgi:hypothetical protein